LNSPPPEENERERSALKEALLFVPNVAKLAGRLAKDPRVHRKTRWGLVLFGLYLANPIDLIPDWLPVIGYLDDVVLIALAGRWVARNIPAELIREHWDGKLPFPEVMARLTHAARRMVPEKVRRRYFGDNPPEPSGN
jgi:uncharacterized membrane protein YkvA (DUF1232 family)